ncbi:MAG: alpha-L-fucosidase [bacterium]
MKKWLTLLLIGITVSLPGQQKENEYVPERDPLVMEKLEEWQNLKFGLLMHWGPYSQWGIVESWSICAEDYGWCRRNMDDYTAYKSAYEKLPETFNPVHFNPENWAKAAHAAGMKYVIFTTKHHDGFCMYDSKYTDYKITSEVVPFHTNPRADIAGEIFNAFRNEGFWTGAYFSKPDWHSDDYWWPNFATPDRNVNYDPEVYPERWERFVTYTHNQILELMSGYGPMDILWLDGGWVQKLSPENIKERYLQELETSPTGFVKRRFESQDIQMDELVSRCRELQPGLIVVDRAVAGKNQNYLTPENHVPGKTLPYPWESCIIRGDGGEVYIFILAENEGSGLPAQIQTTAVEPDSIAHVGLLGAKEEIDWTVHDDVMQINFSDKLRQSPPCKYAWVVELQIK